MKKSFILNIKPYSQSCIIICNGTFLDAEKLLYKNIKNINAKENIEFIKKNRDKYPSDYTPENGEARLFVGLPHGYIMMFHKEDSYVKTTGAIVHESLHLTHYVLNRAGIKLTTESEEAFTYLTEYIVEEIISKIWPNK